MIGKEFKLSKELALLASQMQNLQHFEASALVLERLNNALVELEQSVLSTVDDLNKKLEEATASNAVVLENAPLVINCENATEATGTLEVLNTPDLNTQAVITVTPV